MKINTRKIIADILLEVLYEDAYVNIATNKYLNRYDYIDDVNKGFITNTVNGTVKHLITIDYMINQFSKTKVKKMKPLVAVVLRMSVFQAKYLDKVPDSAICNEAVKIIKDSKYKGLSGFVNGVLRNIIRQMDKIKWPDKKNYIKYLSVSYGFPEWLVEYWLKYYDKNTVNDLLKSLNDIPDVSIRCNTLKRTRDEVAQVLTSQNVEVTEGNFLEEALRLRRAKGVANLRGYFEGYFTVQDESSMLVGRVANPKEGDLVLDVCSAPGGKALHAATILNNTGKVIARDIHEHKLELIEDNIERLGIKNIETELWDATKVDDKLVEQVDIVLVDAPCSGLGIIRKKPDIKVKKQPNELVELVDLQKKILEVSQKYVKEDGSLIYSTCTINPKENEEIVEWFLEKFNFELEGFKDLLPNLADDKGYVQLMPHIHGTDGFFIAKFKKRGEK